MSKRTHPRALNPHGGTASRHPQPHAAHRARGTSRLNLNLSFTHLSTSLIGDKRQLIGWGGYSTLDVYDLFRSFIVVSRKPHDEP